MSIRNILVAFNGSDSAETALRYAAALAQDGCAHVSAMVAHSGHETVSGQDAWVPARAREIIAEAKAEIVAQIRTRFDTLAGELGMGERLHYIDAAGRVDVVLAEAARSFDALVLGRPQDGDADEHMILHPDRIAMVSGRPILIVPAGHPARPRLGRVSVAWDGSRAAARALFDALQFLGGDAEVTVLTIEGTHLPRPVDELLQTLARHGIAARHDQLAFFHGIARTLLAHAEDSHPDLLVMGAYEHSKFREDLLGGVTARILPGINVPVLMSH